MTSYPLEDEFGDIVKKARQGHDFAVADIADKLQVPPKQIELWEAYVGKPSPHLVTQWAELLSLEANKLQAIADERWLPHSQQAVNTVANLELHPMAHHHGAANCYIIADPAINRCVVVDPGITASSILATINKHNWELEGILITHAHQDHIAGLENLRKVVTCPVFTGALEQQLTLLNRPVNVVPTPGHTPDSLSFLWTGFACVGDLLFAGSVGRALNAGCYRTHLESVKTIMALPASTLILPGHGPRTSVEDEWQGNPFV